MPIAAEGAARPCETRYSPCTTSEYFANLFTICMVRTIDYCTYIAFFSKALSNILPSISSCDLPTSVTLLLDPRGLTRPLKLDS